MTKVESRGVLVAAILTFIFSLLFFTASLIIKFSGDEIPKEIKIFLNQEVVTPKKESKPAEQKKIAESHEEAANQIKEQAAPQKKEASSAKASSAPAKAAPSPAKTAPAPKPKAASTAKASASASVPKNEKAAPKEVVQPALKKSVEDLMAEQNKPKKQAVWDDSMFSDDDAAVSSTQTAKTSVAQSSISGSAASASKSQSDSPVTTAGQSTQKNTQASSSTSKALDNIKPQSFGTSVTDNITSSASISARRTSSGKYDMQFSGGATRTLLRPSSPAITISEENAGLVDITRTVTISFSVLANGSVPQGGIRFTPSAILPVQIQQEIREQIAAWTFTTGSETNTASFEYTIKVR